MDYTELFFIIRFPLYLYRCTYVYRVQLVRLSLAVLLYHTL